jgi:serine/threonine protein kinase
LPTSPPEPLTGETLELPGPTSGEPAAQEPSLVGLEFADFVLLEEVGRGGMGVVYKARQKSLDRVVAVKLLPYGPLTKPSLLRRFLAEARAAAGLSHPNIVSIYQVGQCPVAHYFAMEYIDGRNLEQITTRDDDPRPMPLAWSVTVMIPVAHAVAFAHSRGVIHRDLKPANIMIDVHKRPVVMDFGIAKVMGRSSGLTAQGAILGTPAYMAPEQAGDGPDKVGPLCDVYSLGAILYRLLTGRRTYVAESSLLTLVQVIGPEMPPPVRTLRPEVPEAVEQIVMKCLSKDPAERPPSAKALALALAQEVPQLLVQPPASRTDPSATPVALTGSGSHRALTSQKKSPPPLPEVALVLVKTGQQIRLNKPENIIGRSADCEIKLKAADVSKQHCRLVLKPDGVAVEDLDSANGTFVNGEAVRRADLQHGDILKVADHTFEVRFLKSGGRPPRPSRP